MARVVLWTISEEDMKRGFIVEFLVLRERNLIDVGHIDRWQRASGESWTGKMARGGFLSSSPGESEGEVEGESDQCLSSEVELPS